MIDFFIIILIPILGLLLYMYLLAKRNIVVEKELFFSDLPKNFSGMKIFFISDIHFRNVHEKILKKIAGKVDFIIIGGDLLEKKVPFERVEQNVCHLTKIAPTYFVWGNNDYEGDVEKLLQIFHEKNVKVLKNEAVLLKREKDTIALAGIDYGKKRMNIEKTLKEAGKHFTIFVSHSPDVRKMLPKKSHIRLFLSGHTHGGQIRFLCVGIREKGKLAKENGMWVLISNGYGTTGLPFRLGARPQTHLLTLKIKQ